MSERGFIGLGVVDKSIVRIVGGQWNGYLAIWDDSGYEAMLLTAKRHPFGVKPGEGCHTVEWIADMVDDQIYNEGFEQWP